MKLISVLLSIYNEPIKMIKESIDSVISQSYGNLEIIIVIDNPKNVEAINLVDNYAKIDKRIAYHINSINIGLAKSLNKALSYSTGEYVARMDADDICYQNRFSVEANYLDANPECDLVCSSRVDIDEQGNFIENKILVPKSDECLLKSLKYGSIITHPSVMMRTDVIKNLNGYRAFPSGQDYDLWLRLKDIGAQFHFIEQPLIKYRIRSSSISLSKQQTQIICGIYARYINSKHIDFDELEYLSFARKKEKEVGFRFYSFICRNISNQVLFYILLPFGLLISRDCRKRVSDSIKIKSLVK